jgi:hypothetical protein
MPRLEVPLAYRRLRTSGDLVVRAELTLAIKTNRGVWEPFTFLVDSGTETTTMPAAEATDQDLPTPKRPVPGLTFQGLEVRSGLLRAQIPGMDMTEYVFPCYFLGDPIGQTSPSMRNLLGLTGVINQIRLAFDGRYSLVAPHGVLVVEKT